MPYVFIWGSYVFQNQDLDHLKNGIIENLNREVYSLPYRYVINTVDWLLMSCKEFVEAQKQAK